MASIEDIERSLKEPCQKCHGSGEYKYNMGDFGDLTISWCGQCAGTGLMEYSVMSAKDPRFESAAQLSNYKYHPDKKPKEVFDGR